MRAVDTQVEEALTQLERSRPDEDPPWIYWADRAEVIGNVGSAYLHVGNPGKALPHLTAGVDAYGPSFARERAHRMARLATAQLRAGDAEQALATAHDAVDLAAALASGRVSTVLAEFAAEADRTVGNSATKELVERTRTSS